MMTIKGMNLVSSKHFVRTRFGEEGLLKLINALNEEDRKIVANKHILAFSGIPLDTWIHFFEVGARELYNNDESFITEVGKFNAERELYGIYKAFIKKMDPGFVFKRVPILLNMYFKSDEGKMEVSSRQFDEKYVLLRLGKFKPRHRLVEIGILGWFQRSLEISGAKNVEVKLHKSLIDDGSFFELLASWDNMK